jgi:hypothetical protein
MSIEKKLPRSVEIIKRQIADLAKVKASSEHDYKVDFASSLFFDVMDSHEEGLKEELKAAEWLESQSDVELAL